MRTLPIRSTPAHGEFPGYSSYQFIGKPSRRRKERYSVSGLGVCLMLFLLAISRYDATAYVYRRTDDIDFLSWFWKARWLETFGFFDFAVVILVIGVVGKLLKQRSIELFRFDRVLVTLAILLISSY